MRRGFALAAVLFALTVLGVLASTAMFAALSDVRASGSGRDLVRARAAAASTLAAVIASWDPRVMDSLTVGASLDVPAPLLPGVVIEARVTRLNLDLFLVRAQAGGLEGAAIELFQVVRLDAVELPKAAVRAHSVDAVLRSRFDGVDRAPAGWICAVPGDTVPALVESPQPDSLFFRFGSRSWAEIAAWASAIAPGGDSLAVRFEPGSLDLRGGRVVGVLVVEGDLTLEAGAEVVGVVLVRGAVHLGVGGGSVYGSLVASQLIADYGFSMVGPVVVYSSCAVAASSHARAYAGGLQGLRPAVFY